MPKYLNNIDLNGNQLLSPVIHVSSQSTTTNGPAGDTTGTEGQIFYNSHSSAKALYFRDDSGWRPIGDISGVTAGAGLSGGGAGGTVSLAIDISEFSDVTPANGDKLLTLDSDGSTEQLTTIAALATLFAGSGLTATNSVIAVDTLNQDTTGEAGSVANALTVDDTTLQLNTSTTYNGGAARTISAKTAAIADNGTALATADQIHTFVTTQTDTIAASTTGNAATVTTNANLTGHITSSGNTTSLGSFTTAQLNAAISDGSINSQTLPTDFVSAANGGTFSGNVSFGDNNISNVSDIALDTITADGNHITIGNQASKTINLGKANTVDGSGNPTNPTVETGVVVKGSLTVDGKLTVAGDFETTSTSNTIIKDKIIQLNSGATGANSADFGFVFNRGAETNVAFRWDESALNFDLIATTSSADSGTINPADPSTDGESVAGSANWQNFRAAGITAVSGFSGDGSSITALNGSSISTGTVAAARIANLAASKINSGTFANAQISSASVTQHEADIDHDALTNFSSDEHFTQANITTVGTIGTGVWQGTVIASAYLDSDTAHLTGAQTFSGVKTFSGGLILDDGSGAAPIIKWVNQDDDEFTIFNNASGKLKFQQKLVGGTATNEATLDENGLDVDSGLSIGGNAVHATDTSTSLGTSDTVVPSQNAVKTYVDSQTSSAGNTGGRQAFNLNDSVTGVAVSNSNKTYTITHGMGASLNYGVEVIRAANGSGETVYTDVTRTTTTIVIDFAVAPTAGDYTALVCKY